jgi:rhodanese-related sulfurtransferase
MGIFKLLFGPKIDFKKHVNEGAIILDVRTPSEFAQGHIKGSVNIPLQNLKQNLGKISENKVIITCCASGMRSGSAKTLLRSNGYPEVYNGGGWMQLERKIS